MTACSCCGEEKPTATLRSRDDVTLCRVCLERLLGHVGVSSTPTLPVVDLSALIAFYERAAFGVRPYRDESGAIGGFAFVEFDGQSVFDLSVESDMDPVRTTRGATSSPATQTHGTRGCPSPGWT